MILTWIRRAHRRRFLRLWHCRKLCSACGALCLSSNSPIACAHITWWSNYYEVLSLRQSLLEFAALWAWWLQEPLSSLAVSVLSLEAWNSPSARIILDLFSSGEQWEAFRAYRKRTRERGNIQQSLVTFWRWTSLFDESGGSLAHPQPSSYSLYRL